MIDLLNDHVSADWKRQSLLRNREKRECAAKIETEGRNHRVEKPITTKFSTINPSQKKLRNTCPKMKLERTTGQNSNKHTGIRVDNCSRPQNATRILHTSFRYQLFGRRLDTATASKKMLPRLVWTSERSLTWYQILYSELHYKKLRNEQRSENGQAREDLLNRSGLSVTTTFSAIHSSRSVWLRNLSL